MNLQRQAWRISAQRGYAMAALLTMLAVLSILLSAALPVWRHEMRREKEAELVFRGEQYARAIGLYNRRFQTYPPNIDVLVQQKFLRRKYKDPVTGKDFRPIYVGGVAGQPSGSAGPSSGGPRPSTGAGSSPRPGQPPVAGGGIMGVTSESDQESIRLYKGRSKYSQWQFVFAQAQGRPGGPGGRPRPGMGQPGSGGPGGPTGPGGPGGPFGPRRPGRPGGPGGGDPQGPSPVARPPGGER